MTRQEKINHTLQDLETELLEALKQEFLKLANGHESKFIMRHLGSYRANKYSDQQTDILERLEKDIQKIRNKLGIPKNDTPINLLNVFIEKHKGNFDDEGSKNAKGIARDIVRKMGWDKTNV